MRKVNGKAFLLICLILCATLALLFSCATTPTLTYKVSVTGDLFPGSTISVAVTDSAGGTADLSSLTVTVTSGQEIASVVDGVLIIAKKAEIGATFTLSVSGEGISASETFAVAAPPVTKVSVVCDEEAEAGDTLTLGAKVLPSVYKDAAVTYAVTRGNATVSGDLLIIGEDADYGETIAVTASFGGVVSAERYVTVKTYQPRRIIIERETDACLPGDSIALTAAVTPSYVKYPLNVSLETGSGYARYDAELGRLYVDESARIGDTVVFKAVCNTLVERATIRVGHPTATTITAESEGRKVVPGETKEFDFTLYPAKADRTMVSVSLARGSRCVDWQGGTSFTVLRDAEQGAEITFILRYSEEVQTTISFTVEPRVAERVSITSQATMSSYLASGAKATVSAEVFPADWAGDVYYDVLEGADLVEETSSGVFTVKAGADRGIVSVQARTSDGIRSETLSFSVSGRYLRVVCSSWDHVKFNSERPIWFILPTTAHTADRTILVPRDVTDIILEGHYDGTEETAYKGLYFYFRNADTPRTVTLSHFATIADYGLGGTVMEFGSSGVTTIVLDGQNMITADTPRFVDNSGETVDGDWDNKKTPSNRELVWRNGKMGYNGANGGTAVSGCELVFKGSGSLELTAGDGTDGTAGGRGADAKYITDVYVYISGSGGDGGNGGDSGVAIRAEKVTFESGYVRAIAGNAGLGAAGGAAGSVSALDGYSVTAETGKAGTNGRNGVCYPAVYASLIVGAAERYDDSRGTAKSTREQAADSLAILSGKIAAFYGVELKYGSSLAYNDYHKYKDYKMTLQRDAALSMQQMQMLLYTLSMMPKNCWREFEYVSDKKVNIYLVESINSGNVLGLTDSSNNVWFATFDVEVRGVIYGWYYNIMLHEFTHVCHYNMKAISAARTTSYETALEKNNYGLDYGKKTNERVYGVDNEEGNEAANCCFLSSYSRTNVREDTAETLSMISEFTVLPAFLEEGTALRAKFDLIVETFGKFFETMTPLHAPNLFAYDHLFDDE
ncbi:MAG: hypothetical protein IJU10_05390 [Clostridia bacterium]|nr:hypothetical protein [Clostridia bacterium]